MAWLGAELCCRNMGDSAAAPHAPAQGVDTGPSGPGPANCCWAGQSCWQPHRQPLACLPACVPGCPGALPCPPDSGPLEAGACRELEAALTWPASGPGGTQRFSTVVLSVWPTDRTGSVVMTPGGICLPCSDSLRTYSVGTHCYRRWPALTTNEMCFFIQSSKEVGLQYKYAHF